jgi:DNA-directed RNA polymerase subunit H (RpoH/RPB5)
LNPKTDISIYRTQGDTDPIVLDLKVQNGGVITAVPSSATVKLNIKFGALISITGSSTTNGVFVFDMTSANTANTKIAKFEVEVDGDYEYVIGKGNIVFGPKLS